MLKFLKFQKVVLDQTCFINTITVFTFIHSLCVAAYPALGVSGVSRVAEPLVSEGWVCIGGGWSYHTLDNLKIHQTVSVSGGFQTASNDSVINSC